MFHKDSWFLLVSNANSKMNENGVDRENSEHSERCECGDLLYNICIFIYICPYKYYIFGKPTKREDVCAL